MFFQNKKLPYLIGEAEGVAGCGPVGLIEGDPLGSVVAETPPSCFLMWCSFLFLSLVFFPSLYARAGVGKFSFFLTGLVSGEWCCHSSGQRAQGF